MGRTETLVVTATDKAGNATSAEIPLAWTGDVPMLVGVHSEGENRAAWDIVRCYSQGAATSSPASMGYAVSYTPLCQPGWPGVTASVNQLQANLNGLPDRPNGWACTSHEMEHPGQKYAGQQSQFIADELVFAKMVRGLKRRYPLSIYRNAMAFSTMPSQATVRGIDGFFASGDYDAIGMDVYSIAEIGAAVKFAAKWHKPLCIPEMGPLDAVPHTDPAILSYMQQGVPAYRSAGALWLTWFDHNGSGADLDQYPNSLAYLEGQIAA